MSGAQSSGVRELPPILEALPDAIAVADEARRLIAVNRRYAETFGERRPDLAGSSCTAERHRSESLAGGDTRCAPCEVFATGTSTRRRLQVPDASGATRRFEATFGPVTGPQGEVTHVVEVWRDVTDRSQLEVQLSHSERLASVGLLAAGVAHEINNPLASMLAGAETLGRWLERARFEPGDLAEARETVEMLEREIERCRDVTDKLKLLGRAYDASPGWVDVNRAAGDTLALLGYELRRRGIETRTDFATDLPSIWARDAAIRGVCLNLMLNAVQAMSGGGRLSVTTRGDREQVRIAIEDSGPGIPAEQLDRIWDPFYTTKPVGQGTGLGLSISSRIVARHGGRITVQSEPGHGARFEVELPIHGPGGEA